jgi:UDP-galactopyranose mutase
LSADLASRVELRDDTDNRLSKKKHQILPYLGYTEFVHKLLDGIPLTTNYRWTPVIEDWQIRSLNGARVIYTGPLDVLFDNCFGSLKYRSMERVTFTMLVGFGKFLQSTVQTNYPQGDRLYLRSIEWKHILPKSVGMSIPWTTITHENPVEFEQRSSLVREYPFPASSEQERAEKYKALATKYGVVLAGRLAEYRYYDMDVAIENAFSIAERILAG